jgi:Tfp pilus assembly protein PilO
MVSLKNKTIRVGINISIYLAILLSLHLFVGRPILKRLNKEKIQLQDVQNKLSQMQELVRNYPNPRKKMEELKEKMEEFRKKATSEKELPRIIQQLTKKSSELNIEIISIKPIEKVPFKEKPLPQGVSKSYLEVVLKTTYQTLGEYLKALEELPIIFTIESLSIERFEEEEVKEEKGKLIITLLISSYTVWTM